MSVWRRRFKWAVYALLFVDFLIYLSQDVQAAPYTLDERSSLREVLAAYVTSIDLAAWFTLILLFELETGAPAGRAWTGARRWMVRGLRLLCCATILHTSFAYEIALSEFQRPGRLPPSADVCFLPDGWSFLRNREYLEIDAANCAKLGRGPEFFIVGDDAVVTDRAGLDEGRILAWTDLLESVAWLLVVAATEAIVRLGQPAAPSRRAARVLERLKAALYVLIVAIACYWGSKGQFLYFWDELVWVLGFLVIDGNIRGARALPRALSASPTAA
jgi:hypothetical protein